MSCLSPSPVLLSGFLLVLVALHFSSTRSAKQTNPELQAAASAANLRALAKTGGVALVCFVIVAIVSIVTAIVRLEGVGVVGGAARSGLALACFSFSVRAILLLQVEPALAVLAFGFFIACIVATVCAGLYFRRQRVPIQALGIGPPPCGWRRRLGGGATGASGRSSRQGCVAGNVAALVATNHTAPAPFPRGDQSLVLWPSTKPTAVPAAASNGSSPSQTRSAWRQRLPLGRPLKPVSGVARTSAPLPSGGHEAGRRRR